MEIDLSSVPTPKLRAIMQILEVGVPANAETKETEPIGERCEDIVLEPDSSAEDNKNMNYSEEEIKALEKEVKDFKVEAEKWVTWETEKADLVEKATQLGDLTKEYNDLKTEVEDLRQFKDDTEKAAEKAERIKSIKSKLEEAGIEANFEDEAEVNYWLNMTDEILGVTISKMGELKKGAEASASKKIDVPDIPTSEDEDSLSIVKAALQERKQS